MLSLVLAGAARPGAAQEVRLTLSSGRLVDERGDARGGLAAGGEVRWGSARADGGFGLQAALLGGEGVMASGTGRVRGIVVGRGPAALLTSAEGSLAMAGPGYRAAVGEGRTALRLGGGAWSVETGPFVAVGGERRARSAAGGLLGIPSATMVGTHRVERGWRADVARVAGPATLEGGWRTAGSDSLRWTEWVGGGTVRLGPASVGASGGVRVGDLRESWIGARLGLSLGRRAAMVLDAGRAPSRPLTGAVGGRYASAGLVLRVGDD